MNYLYRHITHHNSSSVPRPVQEFFRELPEIQREWGPLSRKPENVSAVPRAQLQRMGTRLGVVETREVVVRRRLEYEEMNFCLLAFLVAAEAKLRAWQDKYGYQPQVEELLRDYQVREESTSELNTKHGCPFLKA